MIDENRLLEVLRDQFGLSDVQADLARSRQRQRGGSLVDILIEMRAVAEGDMRKALGLLGTGASAGPDTPDDERRTASRYKLLPDYGFHIKLESSSSATRCVDLSAGGLGIEMQSPVRIGEEIAVELQSPGGNKVRCGCRVRHARRVNGDGKAHYVAGLEFAPLSASQSMAINALVAQARRLQAANEDVNSLA